LKDARAVLRGGGDSNAVSLPDRHYESDIILLCVRWYLRYSLSYRDLEEMMNERGLAVDHTTIYRWVQSYSPELEKRIRPHLRLTNDSYRVDETYIKVKGAWKYLYRALDSTGQTIDFMLSAKKDTKAAKRFFRKMPKAPKHQSPRVINVVRNNAYPPAIEELKEEGMLAMTSQASSVSRRRGGPSVDMRRRI
jgi:transposase, IS6 family